MTEYTIAHVLDSAWDFVRFFRVFGLEESSFFVFF